MTALPQFQDALVALPTVTALRALLPGGLEALPEETYDALRRDQMTEALEAAEPWLEGAGPSDPDARLGYALLLEGCDQLDRAVDFIDDLRAGGLDSARLDVVEAEIRLERMEGERAEKLLAPLLDGGDRASDLDGLAWGFVADLLLDLGRDDEAIECYERALQQGAEDFETAIRLAKLHQERDHWRRAAEAFERAAELGGDVVGPWREAAECWRRAGELEASLEAREHVLSTGRDGAETWARQGIGYRETGRVDAAIEALEKATRLDPDSPTYWIELAHLFRRTEQPERAIEAYRRVLEFDDTFAEALLGLAAATLEQGDLQRATSAAEEAVEAAPDEPDAHFVLARTYRATNDLDAARRALESALELDDSRADFHAEFGELAMQSERPQIAFDHLERAIELDPTHGRAVVSFAEVLLQSEAYGRLGELLERPETWNETAEWRLVRPVFMALLAELDEGDLSAARSAFESAVEKHRVALPVDTGLEVARRYALVLDREARTLVETMIDILEGRSDLEALAPED